MYKVDKCKLTWTKLHSYYRKAQHKMESSEPNGILRSRCSFFRITFRKGWESWWL